MTSWTNQPNFPVVNVTRENQGTKMRFSQKRFLLQSQEEEEEEEEDLLWQIPISVAGVGNGLADFEDTGFDFILAGESDEIDFYEIFPDQPYMVNLQNTGYYR